MSRKTRIIIYLAVILCVSLFLPAVGEAQEGSVQIVRLDGEVDNYLPTYLQRAFESAENAGAEAIILEITTPGGFVLAAFDIGDVIIQTGIPVYAYVRTYALSAGGYIALACDELYMNAGSTMGSIMPVTGEGAPADEKTFSAVEKAVRSAAERNGRDPEIASAMVRPEKQIDGIVGRGELLTLTSQEAYDLGYTEAIVNSRTEVLEEVGLAGRETIEYQPSRADGIARWLTGPLISPLLLSVAIAALFIELFTAGFGVAGSISVAAFALYFGGHLVAGFAHWEHIAVFLLGIVFLAAEIFIAGFGVLGIVGLVAVAFSIILSAETVEQGFKTLGWATLFAVVIIAVAFRFLRRSTLWQRLVLSSSESKEEGYVGPKDITSHIGMEGVTVTPLRPSGTVELSNGERIDAITQGSYIPRDTVIFVSGYSGAEVVVFEKKE
ncbi:MAG: nodulation protein NfeD [Firmicutes bacterium]|nr:nodulation protein NfeD [Bacillota bacterium]